MANRIGRSRILGIASQPTFGTATVSPTFTLPAVDAISFETVINKERDEASLGDAYGIDEVVVTGRYANLAFNVKVDEDHLPLLLSQRFDISSTTASGDSGAYEHTLTFGQTLNHYFTLFLEDDQQSYIIKDASIDSLNFIFERGQLRAEGNIRGALPTTTTATNSVSAVKTFVGAHSNFYYAQYGQTPTATTALSANFNHTFTLTSEEESMKLGSLDLAINDLTVDEYMAEVTMNKDSETRWQEFRDNNDLAYYIETQHTGRYITGSVANTRPYFKFNYPVGFMETYSENAETNNLIKETLGLLAVKRPGVSGAPMSVTVRNAIASY